MTGVRSKPDPLALNPADLGDLDLKGLREAWRQSFGPPPALRSLELLRLQLLWRLQAARYGGMSAELRARLRGRGGTAQPTLPVGAKLVREWEGVRHDVVVVEGGFAYAGKTWKSLSVIARLITGARWNGPRFFGLRPAKASAS